VNTQTIYITPKSTHELRRITAPEPMRGYKINGSQQQRGVVAGSLPVSVLRHWHPNPNSNPNTHLNSKLG